MTFEDGIFKDFRIVKNKVVKDGHIFLAKNMGLTSLLGVVVGEGYGSTSYTQSSLNIEIGFSPKSESLDVYYPEYGFLSFFGLGQSTGLWSELGAYYFDGTRKLFNRAEITPPINKGINQTAFVGVVVGIYRSAYNY